MKANRNDLTIRFLLGELSAEEQREVEERFLGDNKFFEQVLATEDALIDEYLSGTLSEEENSRARALFESSSEQRQHVEFTKQLLALIKPHVPGDELEASTELNDGHGSPKQVESEQHESTPHSSTPPPYMGRRISTLAWGGGALIFVLLCSWSLYLGYKQRNLGAREAGAEQIARKANEVLNAELARRNELIEELESERKQKEQAEALLAQLQSKKLQLFTTVTLKPEHFERSTTSNLHTVKVITPQIKIQLILEAHREYEKYNVLVTTFDGRKVQNFSLKASQIQQGKLTITLPTNVLGDDDFKIELKGASANGDFEHVGDYVFRLAR